MKIIRLLVLSLVCVFCGQVQAADNIITMFGKDVNGYNQPRYYKSSTRYDWLDRFDIVAISDPDNFPWSSAEQGSVFVKIFEDLAQKEHIVVVFYYPGEGYEQSVDDFEKGKVKFMTKTNAVFGTYYENIPYSKNEYIYPAFFENNIHIITSARNNIAVKTKEDLKNFKGVYSADDRFSSFVLKDFKSLGIKEAKDYPEAYRQLLSGEADYVVGTYYPSQIELYKLGIRDYVVYSKAPVWKMPMFIRAMPGLAEHPRMEYLKKYLRSSRYKKVRDEALQELLDIYRENTKGIVPPTYVNTAPDKQEPAEDTPAAGKNTDTLIPDSAMPLSVNEKK